MNDLSKNSDIMIHVIILYYIYTMYVSYMFTVDTVMNVY